MVERIERTLEGAIGDIFARVFGGNVQVSEVQAVLQREAASTVYLNGKGIPFTADSYSIRLGHADIAHFDENYHQVSTVLARHLEQFIATQSWSVQRPVSVAIERCTQLHPGQFRVSSSSDSAPSDQAQQEVESSVSSPVSASSLPFTRTIRLTEGSGLQHQLNEGVTVLGRGASAQVRLEDKSVSREHCQIWWNGHRAVLQDLGSTNGTLVNGERIHQWQLADGDVVHVGQSLIIVRFG